MSIYFSGQTLLVAPNERQALALWEADAEARRERGETAWETLAACSWGEFLRGLWEEYWLAGSHAETPPALMNEWQERFLWIRSLAESNTGGDLLNLPAAAYLAADAWKITQAYRLEADLRAESQYWPEETRVFMGWVRRFKETCSQNGWLEASRLEASLSDLLVRGALPPRALPRTVRFAGFAEWTPSARLLLSALNEAGVKVEQEEPVRRPGTWRQFQAPDEEHEIETAGRWLRYQLENRPEEGLKVGLVIPNLSERRQEVSRLLTELFQPRHFTSLQPDLNPVCDFSVGLPLSEWPVVEHALSLLRLNGQPQPIEEWALLLNSPYVGEAESEFHLRAELLRKLQSEGRYLVEWSRVSGLALPFPGGDDKPYHAPALGRRLSLLRRELEEAPSYQTPSRWAGHFAALLEGFGWPGERTLDSNEYQTVTRWKRALTQLGSLDRLHGSVSRESALATLRRIADETVYQPKRGSGVVEVMGVLEAVGQSFDYLWLAGFHDGVWPSASRPNPYLPFVLQRKHQVSHATPERELDFARAVSGKLLTAARYGVVSHPRFVGEQVCRPSPLLSHLLDTSLEELKLAHTPTLARLYFSSAHTEELLDPGPAPVDPAEKTRGGTSLFKHQAVCPFRAFAYLRLDARPIDEIKRGLDARERGTMLHAAMEKLWGELKSLRNWLDLPAEGRSRLLESAADVAVNKMRKRRPDVLRGVMTRLERQRLVALLAEWMELESSRRPFEVVATEEQVQLELGGLTLSATIDRVDRLADGSLAVIDYKTGAARVADWLGERPREPQLPLYSVAHSSAVEAICFAVLRTGEMSFQGLARVDETIPGVKASEFAPDGTRSWSERKAEWSERLESLAREFRGGEVRVDPLEGTRSCRFCRLEPLCRIDERGEL